MALDNLLKKDKIHDRIVKRYVLVQQILQCHEYSQQRNKQILKKNRK